MLDLQNNIKVHKFVVHNLVNFVFSRQASIESLPPGVPADFKSAVKKGSTY